MAVRHWSALLDGLACPSSHLNDPVRHRTQSSREARRSTTTTTLVCLVGHTAVYSVARRGPVLPPRLLETGRVHTRPPCPANLIGPACDQASDQARGPY